MGLRVYGYVIMPEHLHLLTNITAPEHLAATLSAFRRFTATRLLDMLRTDRKTWLLDQLSAAIEFDKWPIDIDRIGDSHTLG